MKKQRIITEMYLEGNNGGDYLKIEELSDSLIRVEVGHQCVARGPVVIPVEVLTSVLMDVMSDGWEKHLHKVGWPRDFEDELKNKAIAFNDREKPSNERNIQKISKW